MNTLSAFLIGGTASGSGKTTLTLGIMAAFKARNLKVQPFKCGPDFIDPSLHRMVTGEVSSNLDLRMCGIPFCHRIFDTRCSGKDVAVVEGVMGLFDGGTASSAELAVELDIPVILVVDARSAAESVAAVVRGFEVYSNKVDIAAVIFNRVGSVRHRELIERGIAGVCDCGILGFFPRDVRFEIPDRHLGLHMGDEQPLNSDQLNGLIQAVEEHLDLDGLLRISRKSRQEQGAPLVYKQNIRRKVRLAVARDKAFCFYYEDNLKILEESGVELVFFSPLSEKSLPPDCSGVYFGGGYPELHIDKLAGNDAMLEDVSAFGHSGGIIYGECGGFMYLCKSLKTIHETTHTLCGLFPCSVRMKPRLSSLGYRSPELQSDCLLGLQGHVLHGHEFHYSEIVKSPEEMVTLYLVKGTQREGYKYKNVLGGYIHLHFGQSEDAVASFIRHLEQSQVLT